ncbi:MAG TPA: YicC family protein [Kosmotogaceae bacterium]|nr:MAG: Uncharacterized protein XE05_0266 [Thermotogales bacterium 46_20]HAA85086.1 YicC family protein [Kosmotogaceae bacterium]
MIRSMTGYARVDRELNGCVFSVEVKALNSKYLYLDVTTVSGFNDLEIRAQRYLREKIKRGSIKIGVDITFTEPESIIQPDIVLARTYYSALRQIVDDLGLTSEVTIETLLKNRDIIKPVIPAELTDRLWVGLKTVLEECVQKLNEDREREGKRLQTALINYLKSLTAITEEIENASDQILEETRKSIKNRIDQVLSVQLDDSRLEQEVAILAEKADISEELVRTKSHLSSMLELLDEGEDCGVQLDFFCQELHREFSTIASKSKKLEITRRSVEGRTLVNKLREQVQNIQ